MEWHWIVYAFHSILSPLCSLRANGKIKDQVEELTRFVPFRGSEDDSRYELDGALKVHIVHCNKKESGGSGCADAR